MVWELARRAMTPGRMALTLPVVLLILAGCVAPPARTTSGDSSEPARAATPKTLRLGMTIEPKEGIALFGSTGGSAINYAYTFHTGLTVYNMDSSLQPQLAQKVPSLDDGDWVLLPDGGMEVTWKLRPNLKWHDGTPLSSEDFLFGVQVAQDREIPAKPSTGVALISSASAPDPQTLILRYRQSYSEANASGPMDLVAIPRHLMADLYQSGDKQTFINSPYWTREFVGLGPYRVGEWVGGSHIEALAFDDYVLGRPRIDRLIIRYFSDIKGMVASLLADDIDMSPSGSMKVEEAVILKGQWEEPGKGTVLSVVTGLRYGTPQYRDQSAPWVSDVRARRALVHATDRQAIVDSLAYGLTTVADTPIRPDDPTFRQLEQRGLAHYPYDVARAERLLTDAGWRRGPDGLFVNGAGEPFTIQVASPARTAVNVQEVLTISDEWRQAGLNAIPNNIPYNSANLNELKATVPGVFFGNNPLVPLSYYMSFTTAQLSNERNKWLGSNKGGYSNPAFDRVFEQLSTALDPAQRQASIVELAKIGADEAVWIPLYYDSDFAAVRKGVEGVGTVPPMQVANTWNVHTWDLR